MNSVNVTPGFDFPPGNPDGFPGMTGGVRIATDDLVLTRTPGEPGPEPDHPYNARGEELDHPRSEFHGDHLDFTVDSLQNAIVPFLDGSAERHREYVAPIVGQGVQRKIVFSSLDGTHVRIAANTEYERDTQYVRMEAMIGTAIDPTAFARELVDCRRAMIEYVERAYTDTWRDFSEEIEDYRPVQQELIEELAALVE